MTLPKLYAILDAETCSRRSLQAQHVADAWRDAGIHLIQYRNKPGTDAEVLAAAAMLKRTFQATDATLILNDRIHLFAQTGFQGIHIGQTDGAVQQARASIGPDAVLGISTHNSKQLVNANTSDATYVAIGPVFATGTKLDAAPVVGLEGVRTARALTSKPLIAIGGITRGNAAEVLAAGADSVAVISGLLPPAGANCGQLREFAERSGGTCSCAATEQPTGFSTPQDDEAVLLRSK